MPADWLVVGLGEEAGAHFNHFCARLIACGQLEQLRIAIVTWIERTYHRRRRQPRLGRLTPIEFETIMNKELALAA